ncbi:MAG: AsmA-like C-terminal region-containing protein, partial [Alphaproteobacteria bacterium]|nr:AsmA-like C-terminal region-containing protein [Alphaproteobacteria bacterium]
KGVLALDNGALALKPLDASLVGSAVSGDIGVDTRSVPASVSFNVKAPQLDIGELLREFADLDKLRGGGAMNVALRGTGSSVAEIMASLNGHSRLLMGEGEVKNDFLGTVSGLSQTVGEVFGKKEWIAIECIASDFEVTNGVANSRINVINTELLLITTEGKVDLAQEKPDLKVSPSPKGIDLSLAVPVNVGGSLANPTFTPDTLATAKKIGGILGAIAFPPAAILGLGELGSSDNSCLQTAKADSPQPQAEPSKPETPVEAVTDSAKDAIEDVGKGLKKLFGN